MKNYKFIKLTSSVFIAFILFFSVLQKVEAACTVLISGGPREPQGEYCQTIQGWWSVGESEFSCANYPDGAGGSYYGCYWNYYECDTPCGSVTPPSGGGGGAYQYPTCGGGQELKCGQNPPLYSNTGGNSPVENCGFRAAPRLLPFRHFYLPPMGQQYQPHRPVCNGPLA